jgi:hypothetical protein
MDTNTETAVVKGSTLLKSIETPRAIFDPASVTDQTAFLVFLKTNRWLKKYAVEWPSVTVPATIERKLLLHFLKPLDAIASESIKANGFELASSPLN